MPLALRPRLAGGGSARGAHADRPRRCRAACATTAATRCSTPPSSCSRTTTRSGRAAVALHPHARAPTPRAVSRSRGLPARTDYRVHGRAGSRRRPGADPEFLATRPRPRRAARRSPSGEAEDARPREPARSNAVFRRAASVRDSEPLRAPAAQRQKSPRARTRRPMPPAAASAACGRAAGGSSSLRSVGFARRSRAAAASGRAATSR